MKFVQALVCVAAVGLLCSCANSNPPQSGSSNSPQTGSGIFEQRANQYNKIGYTPGPGEY